MIGGHWRRWRPKKQKNIAVMSDASDATIFLRVQVRLRALRLSRRKWRKTQDFSELNALIDGARGHAIGLDKQQAPSRDRAEAWLYALVLQAPRAAVAQEQMDDHPRGYRNKEHRLFELIDFNDAFDSAVLALSRDQLPYFKDEAKQLMDEMCKRVGTRCFSNEQYRAIVHGLSREIAVYLAATEAGFYVEMTNRNQDAFGIDMRVIEPATMRAVNIDIKARSAYFYRIQELVREGRLGEADFLIADQDGFTAVINGHGNEQRRVVTWRIDNAILGEVINFEFQYAEKIAEIIRVIISRYGEQL